MATITTDPVITLADTMDGEFLSETNETQAILLINDVSEKFKRYMNRRQLNSASIVERVEGNGLARIYVHAPPIATGSTVTVKTYDGVTLKDTYTNDDDELAVINSDVDGIIELSEAVTPNAMDLEHNVEITYTGGWTTIPGDVVAAAVMQMRVDRQRMDRGQVGIESLSQDGQSVSYDSSGLVKEVRDALMPYRIEI